MNGLPPSVGEEGTVQLSGGEVKVRALTVREVRHVQAIKDEETADVVCISMATAFPEAEVRTWIATAKAGDLQALIKEIFRLSGIGEGATFPSPTGNDVGVVRTP